MNPTLTMDRKSNYIGRGKGDPADIGAVIRDGAIWIAWFVLAGIIVSAFLGAL